MKVITPSEQELLTDEVHGTEDGKIKEGDVATIAEGRSRAKQILQSCQWHSELGCAEPVAWCPQAALVGRSQVQAAIKDLLSCGQAECSKLADKEAQLLNKYHSAPANQIERKTIVRDT